MDEAKGIVFGQFKETREIDGVKSELLLHVTGRSENSPSEAIDDFYMAIAHAISEYGLTPYSPVQVYEPIPTGKPKELTYTNVDSAGNELREVRIESMAHKISKSSNKPYLRLYGADLGMYKSAPVWDNLIPAVQTTIDGQVLPLSEAYKYFTVDEKKPVPPQMATALVMGTGKDVSIKSFK